MSRQSFYMDDTSIPYDVDDNPYPRSESDERFDDEIISKYQLMASEIRDEEFS